MSARGRSLAAIAALTLLAGCVTSSPGETASNQEAARLNTDLGVGYFRQGRLDLALERLERAVEQDEGYARAHSSLALVYEALEHNEDAEAHYQQALRLGERDPALLNSYAVFLCRRDRAEEALDYFEQAADDRLYATPAAALTNAGACLRGAGDAEGAEEYLRRALEHDGAYGEALMQLAGLLHERDEHLAARAFVERYLGSAAANPEILWLGHRVEQALGDATAAREYAQQLQEEFPDAAETRALEEGEPNAG